MKDILSREINDYDIVVGKGTGRSVVGMSVGVWIGKSMVDEHLSRRCMSDVFLVKNPSPEELAIKENILAKLNEEKEQKRKKKHIKCIPLKQLVRGGIYEAADGTMYLFLGNNRVNVYRYFSDEKSQELLWTECGNCFLRCYCTGQESFADWFSCVDISDFVYTLYEVCLNDLSIIKSSKKLVRLVDVIDIEKELVYRQYGERANYVLNYKLEITPIGGTNE